MSIRGSSTPIATTRGNTWLQLLARGVLAAISTMATTTVTVAGIYTASATRPLLTGPIHIPAATLAWGVLTLLLSGLLQGVIGRPTRVTLGTALLLVGVTIAGTGLTAVVAAAQEGHMAGTVKSHMSAILGAYHPQSAAVGQLHDAQMSLHCCGDTGSDSYSDTRVFKWIGGWRGWAGGVPTSCCITPGPGCGNPPVGGNIFPQGCSTKISDHATTIIYHSLIALVANTLALMIMAGTLMGYWACAL